MDDPTPVDADLLPAAATDFAAYPGAQTDASVEEFLGRFPLPAIFSALTNGAAVPGLETTLVSCLERIFMTKYGSSLIPHYMPFVRVGLLAESELIRCLACKTVSFLLTNASIDTEAASQLILEYEIYTLLVNCLIDGNERLATAAMDAIVDLAGNSIGIAIVFPDDGDDNRHLKNVAARCSSTARIRVLALIAKLFSTSSLLASAIYSSNLLILFEAEVNKSDDMLVALSALELLYELADSTNATKFLLTARLLQLLASMISNSLADSLLRMRAIMISGRLLSKEETFVVVDMSSIKLVILAIDERLKLVKNEDTDESECALEALGQIGSSNLGAALLLSGQSPPASHVVMAGFEQLGRGRQLAALHALANIAGEKRPEEKKMLVSDAEECLRRLIFVAAATSPKLTPSGLFLLVLRQDAEVRMAAYRSLSGLVKRSWCLVEVCCKQEIIDVVTDPAIETTKNAMEARHNCCAAIYAALTVTNDPGNSLSTVAQKLQEAVARGPYLAKERIESQPVVIPAERF